MTTQFQNSKGFTLLELLVVISIIGLMASIVLVSLDIAREKAMVAKGLQFGSSIYHAHGDELVGFWNFNAGEGAGGTAYDASGFENDGSILGATVSNDTPNSALGKSLELNTGRVYINSITDTPSNMTFEGWFKKTTSDWGSIAFLGKRNGNTGWMLYRNAGDANGYFRWYMHYRNNLSGIQAYNAWPEISGLQIGKWYHIAITRTIDGYNKIYLDGELHDSDNPPANFSSWSENNNGISIGSERAGSGLWTCAGAKIDEVRIYKTALSATEIQKHYAEGAERYGIAVK